ncbi:hypothetical protein [Gordonia sp. CPCC 205333]|uniref:hypothetical protein n=1 Tax=Gordonia sp. CPCC 205333 TaxID=3140790 RepID=UPI003AF3AFC3
MDNRSVFDAATAPSCARSRSGAIAVTATPAGLPTSIVIDDAELRRDPDRLAMQILQLCRQAALVAGVRLREELSHTGFDADALAVAGLPTVDELAGAERAADLAKL